MGGFLSNYGGTILVGALVILAAALIIVKLVRDKRSGKSCCGGCKSCGCEGCGRCEKKDL